MEKSIFDGALLKMSSSRFQLNAPFSQNTGVYTRIFENAAIFIRVVVVLRPRAIARALTACTCADVIQLPRPVVVARLHACVALRSGRRFSDMAEELKKITLEEVKSHNVAGSSWLVIHNKVFDVTKFLDEVSEVLFQEQRVKIVVPMK